MKTKSRRGSGLVECVVGAMVLVPIALCLVDLTAIIMANSVNDTCVKNMARAAANQEAADAFPAAQNSLSSFKPSSIITSIKIDVFDYQAGQSVKVSTRMIVHLPVPFPGYSDLTYVAEDVEPIVVK